MGTSSQRHKLEIHGEAAPFPTTTAAGREAKQRAYDPAIHSPKISKGGTVASVGADIITWQWGGWVQDGGVVTLFYNDDGNPAPAVPTGISRTFPANPNGTGLWNAVEAAEDFAANAIGAAFTLTDNGGGVVAVNQADTLLVEIYPGTGANGDYAYTYTAP